MSDPVGAITLLIQEQWLKVIGILALTLAGGIWSRYRARKLWRAREFLQRVNCSLNIIGDDDKLLIRTIFEMNLEDILLGNKEAIRLVLTAAQRTTKENPFLQFSSHDQWVILNATLNEIAERFNTGTMAADMGLPVHREEYMFGLTCERDDDVRTRKIRIILVRARTLQTQSARELKTLRTESKNHRVRLKTLAAMAELSLGNEHPLMSMEIILPKQAVSSDQAFSPEDKDQAKAEPAIVGSAEEGW